MPLKPSELIIKNDSIYHLGIKPAQIGDFIITVGDPSRVAEVSKYFDKIEDKILKREFVTHTGRLGNKRISVIGTGIGPDNIDILINEIDALKNIDFEHRIIKEKKETLTIIRLGTSGTIQPDIPVDSLVASTHGMGLDGLLNFYSYHESSFQLAFFECLKKEIPALFQICKPTIFECSESLLDKIATGYRRGITITAGGFYGPQGRQLRLEQKMRPVIDQLAEFSFDGLRFTNIEMETSSIYGLSKLLGHHALSVNAIIANRATGDFSPDPYVTIDHMIREVLQRIDAL
jgi:uridine phosphorylase